MVAVICTPSAYVVQVCTYTHVLKRRFDHIDVLTQQKEIVPLTDKNSIFLLTKCKN